MEESRTRVMMGPTVIAHSPEASALIAQGPQHQTEIQKQGEDELGVIIAINSVTQRRTAEKFMKNQ